jgi:hypothetical protein
MRKTPISAICFVALALAAGATPAMADGRSPLAEHRWVIEAGIFLSEFDTSVKLQGPNGGTGVNLENDLGLDDNQTSFRGRFDWRFAERHRLILGYYNFNRTARDTSSRTFVIDTEDQTLEFEAGVNVRSEFDWELIPISYAYSLILTDRFEAAASIGVHWANAKVGFEGEAFIDDNPIAQVAAESEEASAPLPVFGLELNYAATPRWIFGAQAQYFGLDYEDYSGDLTDIRLKTEYRFGNRVGIGVGYTWYDINFSEDNGRYEYDIDYEYDGLEAYLNLRF